MTTVPQQTPQTQEDRNRVFHLVVYRALVMVLAAYEDWLGLPRSRETREERRERRDESYRQSRT